MRFVYTNHSGIEFVLDGSSGIGIQMNDAKGWSWADGGTNRPRYTRPIRTYDATLSFTDKAAFDTFSAACESDMYENEAGTLTYNGWALKCFFEVAKVDFSCDFARSASVTIRSFGGIWHRDTVIELLASNPTPSGGFDYPHDYPIDFGSAPSGQQTISIDSASPVNVKLIVYGEVSNPKVTIGSQIYQVNTTVESGGYLVIDPIQKGVPGASVYKRSRTGVYANCFDSRERGDKGSGTYIFDTVDSGEQLVQWDGTFGFDLHLIESRGEPTWS